MHEYKAVFIDSFGLQYIDTNFSHNNQSNLRAASLTSLCKSGMPRNWTNQLKLLTKVSWNQRKLRSSLPKNGRHHFLTPIWRLVKLFLFWWSWKAPLHWLLFRICIDAGYPSFVTSKMNFVDSGPKTLLHCPFPILCSLWGSVSIFGTHHAHHLWYPRFLVTIV